MSNTDSELDVPLLLKVTATLYNILSDSISNTVPVSNSDSD